VKEDMLESYREAGRIAERVLRFGAGEVRVEASVVEVVQTIEQRVTEAEGAGLAFPLNLSFNEDAAHDTAMVNDERIFAAGDVVKLDLGVHVDGYIADIATTVDLGDHGSLVDASRAALDAAIAQVRPGVTTGHLGAVIQEVIESRGFRPVANLTGHGLDRYAIHTPPTIPNLRIHGGALLKEDMVFAIEPFATTGSGMVSERKRVEIYQQIGVKPVRLPSARQILSSVRERRGMPFARRWVGTDKMDLALQTLVQTRTLHPYPVLHDIPGSLVSQAEHTLIVTAEGCLVTTR
jgi:methionine aminopeptidase, type II (EC 3.4.11.18)